MITWESFGAMSIARAYLIRRCVVLDEQESWPECGDFIYIVPAAYFN